MVETNLLLGKKIRREIRHNWMQFLAIIFIAGLAVTLFVGLSANADSLKNRVHTLYDEGNMADIWVTVNDYRPEDETALRALPDVAALETRFSVSADLDGRGANALIGPASPEINKPVVINEGQEGFLLDASVASSLAKGVGDTVEVQLVLPSMPLLSDHPYTFTITGLMSHPENVQNGAYSDSYFMVTDDVFTAAFTTMAEANYPAASVPAVLAAFSAAGPLRNQYVIKADQTSDIQTLVTGIRAYFEQSGENRLIMCLDIADLPSNAVIQSDIVQAEKLTLVFPVIFFLVAVLIVMTTISQIIIKERTQIGTMKALGIKRRTILNHYMKLTVSVVAIGVAVGLIAGPLIIPGVMNQKYAILYALPALTYYFPWLKAALTAVVMLSVAALVSCLAVRQEVRLSPAGSMRPATPKAQKKLLIEKVTKKEPRDMSWKMALRNIRINGVKSAMVVLGVMGCTALLVCGFGIDDTLNYGIDVDINNFYTSDIILDYYAGSGSLKNDIAAVEGVSSVEEFTLLPATISAENAMSGKVYVIDADSAFFHVDIPQGQVALSEKVAEQTGALLGQPVTFTVLGTNYTYDVGRIFPSFYTHGVFISAADEPALALSPTNAWVNVAAGANSAVVRDQILQAVALVSVGRTFDETVSRIRKIMSSIHLMTMTVKVFAVLLAVIVLYNLAILNYKERYRDIATLRVLGFTRREIARSLIAEVMILTFAGGLFGLFLGKPMEVLVLSVNETPLVAFLYTVFPLSYLYALLITIGVSFVINLYLSNLTDKVPMVESLKSIE